MKLFQTIGILCFALAQFFHADVQASEYSSGKTYVIPEQIIFNCPNIYIHLTTGYVQVDSIHSDPYGFYVYTVPGCIAHNFLWDCPLCGNLFLSDYLSWDCPMCDSFNYMNSRW